MIGVNDVPGDPATNAKEFLSLSRDYIAADLARSSGFERRAFGLLSTVTAALTFLVAALALSGAGSTPAIVKGVAAVALALLVGAAVCSVAAINARSVRLAVPERLRELWDDQKRSPGAEVRLTAQLVEDALMPSVDYRGRPQPGTVASAFAEANMRGRWVSRAVWLLSAALGCLAITGILILWETM